MELLSEITDSDTGSKIKPPKKYAFRKTARAVLFYKGKIALMNVSKFNHHKLPGGGVEESESIQQALKREVVEETGFLPKIIKEVGVILEVKNKLKEVQLSYGYIAEAKIALKQNFTHEEKIQGFKLERKEISQAIRMLEKEKPKNYEGLFIQKREIIFLKKAKKVLEKN